MMVSRRALAFGLAAGPLAHDASGNDDLVGLGQPLDRLRNRCAILGTCVQEKAAEAEKLCRPALSAERAQFRTGLGDDQVWRRWSDTADEVYDTIARTLSAPARCPSHLFIKHGALIAQLELDDPGKTTSA